MAQTALSDWIIRRAERCEEDRKDRDKLQKFGPFYVVRLTINKREVHIAAFTSEKNAQAFAELLRQRVSEHLCGESVYYLIYNLPHFLDITSVEWQIDNMDVDEAVEFLKRRMHM